MGKLTKIVIGVTLLAGGLPLMMIMMRLGTPGFVTPHTQMERVVSCANRVEMPADFCADPEMEALSNEIGEAYERARVRFSESAKSHAYLEETHQKYLSGRDFFPSIPAFINEIESMRPGEAPNKKHLDIQEMMNQRAAAVRMLDELHTPERRMRRYLAFLRGLDAPRAGLEGRWVSLDGEIRIKEFGARVIINETGADRRRCSVRVRSSILNDLASITDAPPSTWSAILSSPSDTLGGWTLRARREGALLKVTERTDRDRSPQDDQPRPFCGGSASLEGLYFPAR